MDKDKPIIALLARLRADLGADAFDIVDHWTPDRCAVGIAMPVDHSQLVYISTFRHKPDEFGYELEMASTSSIDDYDVADRGQVDSYSTLLDIIRQHLQLET